MIARNIAPGVAPKLRDDDTFVDGVVEATLAAIRS
jgi:hypothetical protein